MNSGGFDELRDSLDDILLYYPIGAIQDAPKYGKPWRFRLYHTLLPHGIIGIIPNSIEEALSRLNGDEIVRQRTSWKKSGKWSLFHEHMEPIRWLDIVRGVMSVDFCVLRWEVGIDRGGTLQELYTALSMCVPVYIVVVGPMVKFNDWVADVMYSAEHGRYAPSMKALLGEGLGRWARKFPSFKKLTAYLVAHKQELLERRVSLRARGVYAARRRAAPLIHYPGGLLHYFLETTGALEEFMRAHAEEYHFEEPKDLDPILKESLERSVAEYRKIKTP